MQLIISIVTAFDFPRQVAYSCVISLSAASLPRTITRRTGRHATTPNPTAKSSPTVFTRGRRRARTSDLMIRSRPPRWDTILDQIASDRCQPRAGLQRTELASISQRVMRTSSSNPQGVSISRNERLWNIGRAVRRSVRLGARKLHHLGPLFNFIGEEPAKISR